MVVQLQSVKSVMPISRAYSKKKTRSVRNYLAHFIELFLMESLTHCESNNSSAHFRNNNLAIYQTITNLLTLATVKKITLERGIKTKSDLGRLIKIWTTVHDHDELTTPPCC